MSLQANPLLYLNMGGEMLYVLRQRLKAQGIAIAKSIQVLDEVSASLLNPQIVSSLFQQSAPIDLAAIRANLERAILSSIVRLDETSMNKLFDLMIMMVKYQIQSATGPRELLLITLNHMDAMREMPMNACDERRQEERHQSVVLVHRLLLQVYGNLTHEEMWEVRRACLTKLDTYNVRVSILLRQGLQREDGSFVSLKNRGYNERYEERRADLSNIRLLENVGTPAEGCNVGALIQFVGDRVTHLGTNVYASFDANERIEKKSLNGKSGNRKIRSSKDSRAELGMLAVQLGNSEDVSCCESSSASSSSSQAKSRPFTLRLFSENSPEIIQIEESNEQRDDNCRQNSDDNENQQQSQEEAEKPVSNNHYKAQLDNIYTDLIVDEEKDASVVRRLELLDLMDQLE